MRLSALLIMACALLPVLPASAAEPESVVVLDTEVIIDNKQPHTPDRPGELERARYMTAHIRKAFELSDAYELVDIEKVGELVQQLKDSRKYLHQCEPCARRIGEAADVDYVVTSWVQVVSNLIINLNLVLRDGQTGEVIKTSFNDIRGNNNNTWRGGTNFNLENFFEEYHQQVPEEALKQAQSVWPSQDK